MQEDLFQTILDSIVELLNINWKKIVLYCNYNKESYEMKFYVKKDDNTYIDCYSIPEVKEEDLLNTFLNINNCLSKDMGQRGWKTMTLIVDFDGNFNSYYNYDETYMYENIDEWKSKYLL